MRKTLAAMVAIIAVATLIGTFVAAKGAKAAEPAKDGNFIANSNGTVTDTRTKLMWAAKDNDSDINWTDAKAYCRNYRGGGYKDWRMPTQDELAGLYDKEKAYPSSCGTDVRLTRLIRLTCHWLWASETGGDAAAGYNFADGDRFTTSQSGANKFRVLPVRSGK